MIHETERAFCLLRQSRVAGWIIKYSPNDSKQTIACSILEHGYNLKQQAKDLKRLARDLGFLRSPLLNKNNWVSDHIYLRSIAYGQVKRKHCDRSLSRLTKLSPEQRSESARRAVMARIEKRRLQNALA